MPVRIPRERDALLITLERDGEDPATREAHGGEQALLYAIGMLIACRRLRAGDRLTVRADGDDIAA
jgi:hypothetical protein